MTAKNQLRLEDFVEHAIDQLTVNAGRQEPNSLPHFSEDELRFRHLLLPMDNSPASRNALAWARRIAMTLGSRLTAIHVVEPATLGKAFFGADPNGSGAIGKAKEVMGGWIQGLRTDGVQAAGVVQRGFVVPRILDAARSRRVDLVVLGSKGAGPWSRILLGSVVDAAKNQLPQSVLIAKGAAAPRRILLATDGSRESKRAARVAARLSKAWDTKLTLLHVVPRQKRTATTIERGTSTKRASLMALPTWTNLEASFLVRRGRPAETIVAEAAKGRFDLIVMGSRGLSGHRSVVPGGVSNRVAHAASCSVLLVKSGVSPNAPANPQRRR